MRLSVADRRRPTPADGVLALAVLAAAVLLFFYLRPAQSNFLTAVVVIDQEEIARYDLSAVEQQESLEITDCPYPLRIQIAPGRIRVEESQCPGGDCVHTGWADAPGDQIVCLPNRLVISVSGSTGAPVDAVTG